MTGSWAKGWSLPEAELDLAPDSLVRSLKRIENQRSAGLENDLEKMICNGRPNIKELQEQIKEVRHASLGLYRQSRKKAEVRRQIRDLIIENLRNETYFAAGFPSPRSPHDLPTIINSDLIQPDFFNWEKSTVEGNGLKFVGVRIVATRNLFAEGPEAPSAKSNFNRQNGSLIRENLPEPRPRGRPSVKNEIGEAFAALRDQGSLTPDDRGGSKIQKIKTWIKATYPDRKVPGDESIRKFIKDANQAQ